MIDIIKKRIRRLEYEAARFKVCRDAGQYDGMVDMYFEVVLVVEKKLNGYRVELAKLEN